MDTGQIIILGLAVAVFASKYINFGSIWSKVTDVFKKEGSVKTKKSEEFVLVDAVALYSELKECLSKGKKEKAIDALNKVFPLMNEE